MFAIVIREEKKERYYILNVSDITAITDKLLERNRIKKESIIHIYKVDEDNDRRGELFNKYGTEKESYKTITTEYDNYFKPFYKQNGIWIDDYGKIGIDEKGESWAFVGFRDETGLYGSTKYKVCCIKNLQTKKTKWTQKKDVEKMFDMKFFSFNFFKQSPNSKYFEDNDFNKAYINKNGEIRRLVGFVPVMEGKKSEYICKVVSSDGQKLFKATIEYVKKMLSERPYEPKLPNEKKE